MQSFHFPGQSLTNGVFVTKNERGRGFQEFKEIFDNFLSARSTSAFQFRYFCFFAEPFCEFGLVVILGCQYVTNSVNTRQYASVRVSANYYKSPSDSVTQIELNQ